MTDEQRLQRLVTKQKIAWWFATVGLTYAVGSVIFVDWDGVVSGLLLYLAASGMALRIRISQLALILAVRSDGAA